MNRTLIRRGGAADRIHQALNGFALRFCREPAISAGFIAAFHRHAATFGYMKRSKGSKVVMNVPHSKEGKGHVPAGPTLPFRNVLLSKTVLL